MYILKKIKNLQILENQTITEAIKKINKSKIKILFVTNKKKILLGSITDGDVRRTIIKKKKIDLKVSEVMNKKVKFFIKNKKNIYNYKELFKMKLFCIPIVDKSKKISKFLIKDVDQVPRIKNTVFLMAGGKGLRLRPLTKFIPKPLLKINNIPIIERIIENFKNHGFSNFVISVKYLGSKIKAYVKKRKKFGMKVEFITEKKFLGTAGSLYFLKKNDSIKYPIVLTNSDLITNINYKNLIDFHIKNKSDLTICVRNQIFEMPYGEVFLNGKKISKIIEKPSSNAIVNAGIYVLNQKITNFVKNEQKIMMNELINIAIKKRYRVLSFPIYENWIDVGNKEQLLKAKNNKY